MNEKLSILTELIKVAKIDKKVDEPEYEFLIKIASMIGVDKADADTLFKNYEDFNPPELEFDRIVQFQRLVLMANVDLKVESSEMRLLKSAGMKLGLNIDAVDTVLNEMKNHPNGMIPTETLIEIFRTHLN
ncbi:MAG: TerB family tellurite resistance protein [Bacteroidia bacterium]|nr:TerB family tellurite resistance protein [Bacteroidia bacterium]